MDVVNDRKTLGYFQDTTVDEYDLAELMQYCGE